MRIKIAARAKERAPEGLYLDIMVAEHCAKHGKIALTTMHVRLTSDWGHYRSPIIHYQCIEGPTNTRP